MKKELILASHNEGKIGEFKAILEPLGYKVLSAKDLGVSLDEVIEDGLTLEDNARIKSKFLHEKTGLTVISDDSGLFIDSFPEILGVYSARYLGEDTPYDIKISKILELMNKEVNRLARFTTVISLYGADVDLTFKGNIEGSIAFSQKGTDGFGYDSMFVPEGFTKTFAEIDPAAKNKISHRKSALNSLAKRLVDHPLDNSDTLTL